MAAELMVLIASLCTLLPLGAYLLGGDRSTKILGDWKTWMAEHNGATMTVVLAVLGAEYIGDALSALTTQTSPPAELGPRTARPPTPTLRLAN